MFTKLTAVMIGCCLCSLVLATEPLRVMTWNVQRGAKHFDDGPAKTVRVIRDSRADIVLMQESYENDALGSKLGAWVGKQLGWQTHQGDSPHLCILSRYPITETFSHAPWHGVGAKIRLPGGQEILVWSCWIDYRAFMGQRLIDKPGSTDAELLACETTDSGRAQQTRDLLARLKALGQLESKLPLLVGGDWNCPSHLDYTEAVKDLHQGRVLPLPSSLLFEKEGFTDAYRVVHPDVRKHPGLTWSPLVKVNDESRNAEAQDRIVRLYLRNGGFHPVAATVFPVREEDSAIPQSKRIFPSDHAAVLIELEYRK